MRIPFSVCNTTLQLIIILYSGFGHLLSVHRFICSQGRHQAISQGAVANGGALRCSIKPIRWHEWCSLYHSIHPLCLMLQGSNAIRFLRFHCYPAKDASIARSSNACRSSTPIRRRTRCRRDSLCPDKITLHQLPMTDRSNAVQPQGWVRHSRLQYGGLTKIFRG